MLLLELPGFLSGKARGEEPVLSPPPHPHLTPRDTMVAPVISLEKQSNPEVAKAWPGEECMWFGIDGSLPECVCVYASEPRPLTSGKLTRLCVFWGLCMAT